MYVSLWRDPFCGYWCLCRLERLVTRTGVTTSSNWSNQPFFHACFFENGGKEGMLTINYVAIRIRLIKIRALVELDSSAHTNTRYFWVHISFYWKFLPLNIVEPLNSFLLVILSIQVKKPWTCLIFSVFELLSDHDSVLLWVLSKKLEPIVWALAWLGNGHSHPTPRCAGQWEGNSSNRNRIEIEGGRGVEEVGQARMTQEMKCRCSVRPVFTPSVFFSSTFSNFLSLQLCHCHLSWSYFGHHTPPSFEHIF